MTAKIDYVPHTLNKCAKGAEIDSGAREGITTS